MDHQKPRNWKTPILVLGSGLAVVLTLAFGFDSYGFSALNQAVQQARSLGGPLTLEELEKSRPEYPAEKNGANVIQRIQPKLDATANAVYQLKGPAAEDLPVLGPKPDPGCGERWTAAQLARAEQFLAGMENELAAIDSLNNYRGGRFNVPAVPYPSFPDQPYLETLRFAAKLKVLQILDRAMRAEASHIRNDVGVIFQAAALIDRETSMITGLIATALRAYAVETLERAYALVEVDPGQLEQLQSLFSGYDLYGHVQWAVRSERAAFIERADYCRATKRLPGLQGLFLQDEAHGIEIMSRVLAQHDVPSMIAEYKSGMRALTARTPVLDLLFPDCYRGFELLLRGAASIRSAELAMAVERYRLAKGDWPQKLDVLVPGYIKSIPEDPFAPGQPLRMVIKSDRLVVYSLDIDRDDDGGVEWDGKAQSGDTGFVLLAPSARPASRAHAE